MKPGGSTQNGIEPPSRACVALAKRFCTSAEIHAASAEVFFLRRGFKARALRHLILAPRGDLLGVQSAERRGWLSWLGATGIKACAPRLMNCKRRARCPGGRADEATRRAICSAGARWDCKRRTFQAKRKAKSPASGAVEPCRPSVKPRRPRVWRRAPCGRSGRPCCCADHPGRNPCPAPSAGPPLSG